MEKEADYHRPPSPAAEPGSNSLTDQIKAEARRLGFAEVGVCPAVTPVGLHEFHQWLAAGYAGEMQYLADRADAYAHPVAVLPGARSLVMLALPYANQPPVATSPGQGRVSRYAWGRDYHELVRERLDSLVGFARELEPAAKLRGVIDTAPLLEREFAQFAGLGWIGKNSLLLNRRLGSWFFLAALLTDLELDYDEPFAADHCGTCRACLDACPTDAFVAEGVLDARRCISYLTIELKGSIPAELRGGIGQWAFGCDVCQEVCPWNHKALESTELDLLPAPGMNPLELAPLFSLSDGQFRARFRHTPLWRTKRRGLLRTAAIVLGNTPTDKAIPALINGLNDVEPVIREACAWALGHYGAPEAKAALTLRRTIEDAPAVAEAIDEALAAERAVAAKS